ncbi:MAG: hypothetical protein ACTSQI_21950 [Candidatus Helarchaeota archaeon]
MLREALPRGNIGNAPKSFLDVFLGFLREVFTFVLLVAFGPILLAAALITALIYVGLVLLGPIFAAVALLLLKIIILIFALIALAISLLMLILAFLTLFVGFIIIGYSVTWINPLYLKIEHPTASIEIKAEITWSEWVFLGIELPNLRISITNPENNNEIYFEEGIITSFSSHNLEGENLDTYSTSTEGNQDDYQFDWAKFAAGMIVQLLVCFLFIYFVGSEQPFYMYIIYIVFFIVTQFFFYSIFSYYVDSNPDSVDFLGGMGFGCMIAGIIISVYYAATKEFKWNDIADYIALIFAALGFVLGSLEIFEILEFGVIQDILNVVGFILSAFIIYQIVIEGKSFAAEFAKKIYRIILCVILKIFGMLFLFSWNSKKEFIRVD